MSYQNLRLLFSTLLLIFYFIASLGCDGCPDDSKDGSDKEEKEEAAENQLYNLLDDLSKNPDIQRETPENHY